MYKPILVAYGFHFLDTNSGWFCCFGLLLDLHMDMIYHRNASYESDWNMLIKV